VHGVCLVGSSEDSYGFGNGSLRSLAVLVLRPAEPSPLVSLPSVGTAASDGGARHLRPQQEGVVFAISGRHGHSTRPASFATPGYGESPGRYSVFHPKYGFVPVAAVPVLDRHMATAARRMVATSEGGGRPCHRSRPLRRGLFIANTQHKQSVISTSSCSCRPWRWWAQVTASQWFLAPHPIGETAGGNGNIQLRLDSGDASSSAGERLAAATAPAFDGDGL
jgi:hypothetical protein